MINCRPLYSVAARRLAVEPDGQGRWCCALAQATKSGHVLRILQVGPGRAARRAHTLLAGSLGILDVCLSRDTSGALLAVWNELGATGAALRWARRAGDGAWTAPAAVCNLPGSILSPVTARDAAGRVWCAFHSNALGKHHIFVTWLDGGQWSFPQRISDGNGHCLSPAACPLGEGVRVVWEAHVDGASGIYMREVKPEPRLSRHEPQATVARGPELVANPAIVAIDARTSLVVWERGQAEWGARNDVDRRSVDVLEGNYLRARRDLVAAVIGPRGLAPLAPPLERALRPSGGAVSRSRPAVARDGAGGVWLAWRQLDLPNRRPVQQGYRLLACRHGPRGWREALELPGSGATADAAALLTGGHDGQVLAGYVQITERRWRAHLAALTERADAQPARPATGAFAPMRVPQFAEPRAHVRITIDGRHGSPVLLWGDLHRHSDLSPCWWMAEGTPQDTYRYALSAADLDFLALTEHASALRSLDAVEEARLAANAYNLPGAFTAFVACEANPPGQGHVVVLTDGPRLAIPSGQTRRGLYRRLTTARHVIIPHHMGDPDHPYPWDGHDQTLSPVAELYQPYRTSFEAPGAPAPATAWAGQGKRSLPGHSLLDAWQRGLHLGVLASSDHLSTGGALAAVWARGNSRADILEALRARRCYGATDRIVLRFWADGHFMGERFTASGASTRLEVSCRAPAALRRVELLCDGQVVHLWQPRPFARATRQVRLRRRCTLALGEHAFTVRVYQQGDHMAWSSPIWITGERPGGATHIFPAVRGEYG